jgi:hypothetical protein
LVSEKPQNGRKENRAQEVQQETPQARHLQRGEEINKIQKALL